MPRGKGKPGLRLLRATTKPLGPLRRSTLLHQAPGHHHRRRPAARDHSGRHAFETRPARARPESRPRDSFRARSTGLPIVWQSFRACEKRLVCPALATLYASPETWPSGRRRSPAKGVGPKGSRGFESHRLRQPGSAPGIGVRTGVHPRLHSWCRSFTVRRSWSPRRDRRTRPSAFPPASTGEVDGTVTPVARRKPRNAHSSFCSSS